MHSAWHTRVTLYTSDTKCIYLLTRTLNLTANHLEFRKLLSFISRRNCLLCLWLSQMIADLECAHWWWRGCSCVMYVMRGSAQAQRGAGSHGPSVTPAPHSTYIVTSTVLSVCPNVRWVDLSVHSHINTYITLLFVELTVLSKSRVNQ